MVLLVGGNTYNKEEEGRRRRKKRKRSKRRGRPARTWSSTLPSPFVFKLFELVRFNKVWRLGLNICVVQKGLG